MSLVAQAVLVTDGDVLEVEGLRVAVLGSQGAPGGVGGTVGEPRGLVE